MFPSRFAIARLSAPSRIFFLCLCHPSWLLSDPSSSFRAEEAPSFERFCIAISLLLLLWACWSLMLGLGIRALLSWVSITASCSLFSSLRQKFPHCCCCIVTDVVFFRPFSISLPFLRFLFWLRSRSPSLFLSFYWADRYPVAVLGIYSSNLHQPQVYLLLYFLLHKDHIDIYLHFPS